MEITDKNKSLWFIYGLEERPPLRDTLFAAIQHL